MSRPWMKFYPADWRAEPRLRMCSLAARGLWIDLMTYMHEGEPYGHLTIDGIPPSTGGIASLVGRPLNEVLKALAELEARRVFDRSGTGAIISRRMVRDKGKAERDRENGKGGGNPELIGEVKGGVNPPLNGGVKAQKLETRKKEDAAPNGATAAPPSDPKKRFYDRGKEVLGDGAGGLCTDLLKAKGGDVALAIAAIEVASTKSNPRQYVGGIVKANPREGEFTWKSGIPGVL